MRLTKILHTRVQNLKILKAQIKLSITAQQLTSCERGNFYTLFAQKRNQLVVAFPKKSRPNRKDGAACFG